MKQVYVPAKSAERILQREIARIRYTGELQIGDQVIVHLGHSNTITQIKSKPTTINGKTCYKVSSFGGWISKENIEVIKSC